MFVSWCNGSTAVFGTACLGSSPGETTDKYNNPLSYNMLAGFIFEIHTNLHTLYSFLTIARIKEKALSPDKAILIDI